MEGLSAALDSIWTDSGRMVAFADAQIDPLMTRSNLGVPEIIYVRDVKKHLDQGLRPSEVMKWEDWRQRPRFREILISNRTPSPTGFSMARLRDGPDLSSATPHSVSATTLAFGYADRLAPEPA